MAVFVLLLLWPGSIPGWETKIPQVVQCGPHKIFLYPFICSFIKCFLSINDVPSSIIGANNTAENKGEKYPCPDGAYVHVVGQ